MTIKELCEKTYKNACEKGFYSEQEELNSNFNKYNFTDNLTDYVFYQIVSTKLMLIVSELSESLEALRTNKVLARNLGAEPLPDFDIFSDVVFKDYFQNVIKDTFEDELADTAIRLFDLCGWLGIDLEGHIKAKMRYNATRECKHNKAF